MMTPKSIAQHLKQQQHLPDPPQFSPRLWMRVERVALAQDPLVGRRGGGVNGGRGSAAAAAAVLEATGHDEDGQEGVGVEQEEVVDVGEALQIVGGLFLVVFLPLLVAFFTLLFFLHLAKGKEDTHKGE